MKSTNPRIRDCFPSVGTAVAVGGCLLAAASFVAVPAALHRGSAASLALRSGPPGENGTGVEPSGTHVSSRTLDAHLGLVQTALATGDVSAAIRAWHDARGLAVRSGRADAMIAVGDAFVEIDTAAGTPSAAKPAARQAYLVALNRAHRDRSAETTARVAHAFARIGDRALALYAERLAEDLAADAARRSHAGPTQGSAGLADGLPASPSSHTARP